MQELSKPFGHADLVDALLELATATSRTLDDLTRARDVPDRAAALDHLHDAYYELLAPISLLTPLRAPSPTGTTLASAQVVVMAVPQK